MSPESLDAIDATRKAFDNAPITHFVSSAYFTKPTPDPEATSTLVATVRPGDEVAVHLHAWRSLAQAAGITPRLSPSFLTGTNQLSQFADGDVGFDVDLDAYPVADLRSLLRTSRALLEATKLPVSTSFRAGGYLATPKVLDAIEAEGFAVDSSATDYRRINVGTDEFLGKRLQQVWPKITPASQPYNLGKVVELPIAAIADYASAADVVAVFEAAHARLKADPGHDQYVVLAFHEETAGELAKRLIEAIATVHTRPELARELTYSTIEHVGARVRSTMKK